MPFYSSYKNTLLNNLVLNFGSKGVLSTNNRS